MRVHVEHVGDDEIEPGVDLRAQVLDLARQVARLGMAFRVARTREAEARGAVTDEAHELRFSALRFTVTRLRDFFLNPVDDQMRVNKDFREFYERLRILRREREGGMEGVLMAMATGYDYRKYQKVKALEKKGSK